MCVLLDAHSALAAGLLVGRGRCPAIPWAYTGPTLQQGPAFDGYFEFFSPPSLKIALAYFLHVTDSRDIGRVDGKEDSYEA